MNRSRRRLTLSLISLPGFVAACGGGGGSSGGSSDSGPTIVSIQSNPPTLSVTLGVTWQYTAQATYSDGTKRDLGSDVTWASSDTSKVTIDAKGLAKAIARGSATITATFGALRSSGSSFTVVSSWTATGSLITARELHTATLLPNGKVLVIGGSNFVGTALAACELFDPTTGTWSATSPLTTARSRHQAILLGNGSGKVLVIGGIGTSATASCELYDPATGTWSLAGNLAAARWSHAATLLASGKVLVAGGTNGPTNIAGCELYDPVAGTWSPTGSIPVPVIQPTACLLKDGKVLASGGLVSTATNASTDALQIYDPATGVWHGAGSMVASTYWHTATVLGSGKVLLAGGSPFLGSQSSSQVFDPSATGATRLGTLNDARFQHAAVIQPEGVLVIGGQGIGEILKSCEVFDATTGAWARSDALMFARTSHTATLLQNGQVLVAGGDFIGPMASCELR